MIDHIFIFSNKGQEANALVEFGLTEGSGRTHPGVGTANRRFFFENVYLEILWVADEAEAKSVDSYLGIWERSNLRSNDFSPFGLCLQNTAVTNPIFTDPYKFHPDFLPQGQHIEIITNETMPWIFRFPPDRQQRNVTEPKIHTAGLKRLTKTTFHLKQRAFPNVLDAIEQVSTIEFKEMPQNSVILEFDHGRQGKARWFEGLSLMVRY